MKGELAACLESRADDATLAGDALAGRAEEALAAEQLDEAVRLFDRAEPDVADPDRCAGGRWMAQMLGGHFEAAWRESDAIRRRGAPDPHRFWQGEDFRGKRLMLRSLHGFGDAVQMFRFLPRLQAAVQELIVEVPPRLVALAPFFDGMGTVITWGEQAPAVCPAWDVQMEVMELPYALRVEAGALAPCSGYLQLPQQERERVRVALGPREASRVGVVWCAGEWNPSRSIPFAEFRALLRVPGVAFWSLQGGAERSLWTGANDASCCGEGILALAAAIAEMDLVITVDTLAAHLAGALGVPCWLLLQERADWRWMVRREDSPWYPSLRLRRQTAGEGWKGLVQRTVSDLQMWAERQAREAGN